MVGSLKRRGIGGRGQRRGGAKKKDLVDCKIGKGVEPNEHRTARRRGYEKAVLIEKEGMLPEKPKRARGDV